MSLTETRIWCLATAAKFREAIFGFMVVALTVAAPAYGQNAPEATSARSIVRRSFEVASVKPCVSARPSYQRGVGNVEASAAPSPDRLSIACATPLSLIQRAYILYAGAQAHPSWSLLNLPIEGAPAWLSTDKYEITAKAAESASQEELNGPMLQALLEERFKLQIHREAREVPVYVLTAAKSGPKLGGFTEGSCLPRDLAASSASTTLPPCNASRRVYGLKAVTDVQGLSVPDFVSGFLHGLDRPVLDRTGIQGRHSFQLEYAVDEHTPGLLGPVGFARAREEAASDRPPGAIAPSIFTALRQQLGLQLEAGRGPWEFLVIQKVERPGEN